MTSPASLHWGIAFAKEQIPEKFHGMWGNRTNPGNPFKKPEDSIKGVKTGRHESKIQLNYYESQELKKEAIKLEDECKYEEAIWCYMILVEAKPHNANYKNKLLELKSIKPEAEKAYKKAMELEQEHKYKEAIMHGQKAIDLDPNNRKYKIKLQEIENKLEIENKQNAEKYYKKAMDLERQGKYSEALESYERAIELDPNNEMFHKSMETCLEKEGMMKKQAEEFYKRALSYKRGENYEEAIYYCREAMELDPNSTKYQHLLIVLEDELKQRNEMEERNKERIIILKKGAMFI